MNEARVISSGTPGGMSLGKLGKTEQPKLIGPVVGDKLRFLVFPFGQLQLVGEEGHAKEGQTIIEVSVEAIKTTRVTYE